MKKIIFVSTGRCGTKRIYELLKSKELNAVVKHQMPLSRLANVIGNFMFAVKENDSIKNLLYSFIISKFLYKKYFICTDPLTAMIIPEKIIKDPNTLIIHIIRPKDEFATSFFEISRKRFKSFIAHNFIPFWQIGMLPFENLFNKKVLTKYKMAYVLKNQFFFEKYSINPNYKKILMADAFHNDTLSKIIKSFTGENILFSKEELSKKSNT